MNNRAIAALTALIVIAGGTGYIALNSEKPSFGLVDKGDWENVSEESITVSSEAWINNPYPIGLSIDFIDVIYSVEANDITIAEGKINEISLEPGNNTKTFKTELKQKKISGLWVSHLNNGEKSQVSAPTTIETPITDFEIEAFSREINTDITSRIEDSLKSIEGNYRGPGIETTRSGFTLEIRPEMEIRDFKASWGKVTEQESTILMDMKVHNPNSYPLPTPSLGGKADLNNITIAEWTANSQPLTEMPEEGTIGPGETEELRFAVGLKNQKMDEWLETHVKNTEYTEAKIDAHLIFNIQGQEFKAPAGEMNCITQIQTDILVDDKEPRVYNKGCEPKNEAYPSSEEQSTGSESETDTEQSQSDEQNLTQGLLN